jgi:hypothetical protein
MRGLNRREPLRIVSRSSVKLHGVFWRYYISIRPATLIAILGHSAMPVSPLSRSFSERVSQTLPKALGLIL